MVDDGRGPIMTIQSCYRDVASLEQGLAYLTYNNPGLTPVATHSDIRLAVIAELKRRF